MIVESLLAFYKGNDPLNQDLWSDLNDYRRGLLSGDDNQKTLGRKLNRKMRDIRRDAGQPAAGDASESEAGADEAEDNR